MKKHLLYSVMFGALLSTPVWAEQTCRDKGYCEAPAEIGKQAMDSQVSTRGIGTKTPASSEHRDISADRPMHTHLHAQSCEQARDGAHKTALPFRISIDGVPLDQHDALNSADVVRCHDMALKKADIQVRFDRLEETQALNVISYPQAVMPGETITFTPYSNYNHFIDKAEIRIFKDDQSLQSRPIAVIPAGSLQEDVSWTAPKNSKDRNFKYVLRVYDTKGRFDETKAAPFHLVDAHRYDKLDTEDREKRVGYGENNLDIQNIPVSGGMVTINGQNLQPGAEVIAMGAHVPVDTKGKFAYRQILPEGKYNIPIAISNPDGSGSKLSRAVDLPEQDWFYIGLADVTVGKNSVSGPAQLVTGQNTDKYAGDFYMDGRLAFYTKGKLKDGWELTASADTKEQPIEDLFTNFTKKDPRALLKRLDPSKYYQVYGDDSTTVEDAQTQGKFYIKAAKDDSHIMWGNFQTAITGTDLIDYRRTLYGAGAEYNSARMTSFGERKTEVDAFAADPGTIPAFEEFRGTGGSLYYLQGQDVVIGSERLRIETRDRDSGIVLSSQYLIYGQDYEINYTQGRVILREALQSTSTQNTLIRTGALSGHPTYLVAAYEYAPSVTDVENLTKGGRASHWFGNHLRLGASLYDQNGAGISQTLGGVDAILRYTPETYLKVEAARSEGVGNGGQGSVNGGFNFDTIGQTTTGDVEANAVRAEVGISLGDIFKTLKGKLSAYTMYREDGYSAPGQLTDEDVTQHGLTADIPVTENVTLNSKLDYKSGNDTGDVTTGEIGGTVQLDQEKSLSLAVRHDERSSFLSGGNSAELSKDGGRTDAAVKYLYAPLGEDGQKGRYEIYGLAQATLDKSGDRDRNNRLGIGGRVDLTDRLSFNGEATGGNGGVGALAGLEFQKTDRTSYYINYQIDNERTDIGYRGKNTSLTMGGKSRYSDSVSIFSEHKHVTYDNASSGVIHAFGLDLAAGDSWTWGGRFENGTVTDKDAGDTDRTAVSLSANYGNKKVKYGGTIEYRDEDNDIDGKRNTFLMSNNLSYQTSKDWRLLADFDFAISESDVNSSLDADFIELGLGYAYRPVDNDRLNALIRYEFLSDLAPDDQLNGTRTSSASDYEQRSHVVSADAIYDITPKISVGGKVGYRHSEIRDKTIAGSEFFDSNAFLLIGRVDYHVVKDWEFTGELRHLEVSEAEDAKSGVLIGAYKHINQNVKVGAGYNFTDFSDDLTDLDYESKGAFLNIIGKF